MSDRNGTQDSDDITPRPCAPKKKFGSVRVIHRWSPDKNILLTLPIARCTEGILRREASTFEQTEACKT